MQKAPTYREIGRACGFNSSTVSRALAGNARISEETRKKIRTVAESMGWSPNPLASAFMAHVRSTQLPKYQATIGYIISFANYQTFSALPEYNQEIYRGANTVAAASGYSLQPIWLREVDFKFPRLNRLLKSRGIVGVIAHGGDLPPDTFSQLDWSLVASSTWGFTIQEPQLHRAAFNMTHGVRLAIRKAREYGYRHIAMIISARQDALADHALLAACHYESRCAGPNSWLEWYEVADESAASRQKLAKWLLKYKPDCIIGEQPAWETLREMNWKVPEQVAFISPHWSKTWPHIGGVNQRPDLIGENAFDLIAAQILRNERGIPTNPKLVLSEGAWVDGLSIPRRS